MSRQEILNTLRETQVTRLVYFGYVYEDQDEMALGRLRIIPIVKPNQTFTQAIEEEGVNNLEKNKWDKDKDEYLFLPLLPYEINPVALKGELVLLLYGDKSYPQQNKFYVKSLVSSPSALELENYQKSQSNYAEGTRVEPSLSPKNNQGEYRNEKIRGIYPEPGDNALLGRGSADIIVKRDEVLVRAGKTQGLNPETLSQGYQNRAFLQLSNFKQTKVNKDPETKIQVNEIVKSVKKMVIWNIDNLENTQDAFNGWVRLVKIVNNTEVTNTKNFKLDTITKLSVGTDYTNPEAEIVFNTKTKEEITKIFNDFINGVLYGNINLPDYQITKQVSDQFPLVVTPSYATYTSGFSLSESVTTNDVAELRNFSEFFSKVKVNQNKFEYGWILVPKPPTNGKVVTGPLSDIKTETVTPSDFIQSPATYGILGAQKIYLLSPTVQGAPRGDINLRDTLYGIPQPKFVGDEKSLEYQTYPTVRGDQLMILLRKIFEFVKGHVHPVATMQPIPVSAGNGQTTQEIDEILSNAENKILNQNIRIN